MIRTNLMRRRLLSFLLIGIIAIQMWYIMFMSKNTTQQILVTHPTNSKTSFEVMCYPPNTTPFKRNHLTLLAVTNLADKSAYVNETDASSITHLSNNYSTLPQFIQHCYQGLMARRLIPGTHSIPLIFHNPPLKHMIKPSCDGLWMEFGVYRGGTITQIANWKREFCGNSSSSVYGFDTFSGLPSDWRPGYPSKAFDIPNTTMISVPSNVMLVKGLFIDTLPNQLRLIDQQYQCHTPVSFIHIDCDIYDGARDVLFLLGSRLVSGSIIVFDELFNYPGYEKHEIKALYEFVSGSNIRLIPIGSSTVIDLNTTYDKYTQSFAFIVDLEQTIY